MQALSQLSYGPFAAPEAMGIALPDQADPRAIGKTRQQDRP